MSKISSLKYNTNGGKKMVELITDLYDMKHSINKVKDLIFSQVEELAETISEDDEYCKLKIKIGISKVTSKN